MDRRDGEAVLVGLNPWWTELICVCSVIITQHLIHVSMFDIYTRYQCVGLGYQNAMIIVYMYRILHE